MTDTQASTLPAPPEPDDSPPPSRPSERQIAAQFGLRPGARSHRWWTVPVVVVAFVFLVGVIVAVTLPSSWFVEKESRRLGIEQPASLARTPASAQPVDDRIQIGDLGEVATQYPPLGDIYFVTVMHPEQSLLSWLVGRNEPAIQFLTYDDVYGQDTAQQRQVFDRASMASAEQVAQYVALERLGYDVAILPGEVLIENMVCLVANEEGTDCEQWSPSDAVLDRGDRIEEVDGTPIETIDDLSDVLADKSPGDVVSMVIERPDVGELSVDVELTADPDQPERTIVGFIPVETYTVDLPFELSIDTGTIGGPSAGLAFTLTLIDELSDGELTGGGNVAVTGTINVEGEVGAIGGLRQKASAVAQAGVDLFIVPTAQGEDDIAAARQAAGDKVTIVPVATLEEALAALAAAGGDPLPPVSAG